MAGTPIDMTETPWDTRDNDDPSRMLRDGLRCLHLAGALFLRAHFNAPWAYESLESELIAQLHQSRERRIILFHVFTEGRCSLRLSGQAGPETELVAGDIVILPFADRHRVGDTSGHVPIPMEQLFPPLPWTSLPVVRHGGTGAATSMVCGYLYCDDLPFNPVLASLPRVMRVRPSGGPLAQWVDASVQYALHASSSQVEADDLLLQRLPELLFIECLCEYARSAPEPASGWLQALADPIVGRALACVHREPQYAWTVSELAKRAASSRSVLDERSRALLGLAPMGYLAAFRLQLAARQLRTTGASLAETADAVGYGSEASFSRAFKRHAGVAPSLWREQHVNVAAGPFAGLQA